MRKSEGRTVADVVAEMNDCNERWARRCPVCTAAAYTANAEELRRLVGIATTNGQPFVSAGLHLLAKIVDADAASILSEHADAAPHARPVRRARARSGGLGAKR